MGTKDLIELVSKEKLISIIGMGKNVGKTTTLNYIIEGLKGKKILGITSIGREGEEKDLVTCTNKPRIFVPKGTMIATSKECLYKGDITREILKTTSINTALGEIIICKALSDGYVEIAGPSINSNLEKIKKELFKFGSEVIIIDGAIDRKTFAASKLDAACILSTGAALSPNMKKVIEDTVHMVNVFDFEKLNDDRFKETENALIKNNSFIINKNGDVEYIDSFTTMDSVKQISSHMRDDESIIILKGAVTDKFLLELMKHTPYCKNIVMEDPTKYFLTSKVYSKYKIFGGSIKVLNSLKIIAVTVNPYSPKGYFFDKKAFLKEVTEKLTIPVFDVVGGEKDSFSK